MAPPPCGNRTGHLSATDRVPTGTCARESVAETGQAVGERPGAEREFAPGDFPPFPETTMYLTSFDSPHRTPLDFNTPPRTESVADALVTEPCLSGDSRAPAPESLFEELGLSGHVARAVISERSGPGA